MKPAHYDFEYPQGSDHSFKIQLKPGGIPRDITGYVVTGAIKLKRSDSEVWATIHCTITDAVQGKITVSIKGSETTAANNKYLIATNHDDYIEAVYDVVLTHAENDTRERILEGDVKISPEVTV